jgi:hypothetical protein
MIQTTQMALANKARKVLEKAYVVNPEAKDKANVTAA